MKKPVAKKPVVKPAAKKPAGKPAASATPSNLVGLAAARATATAAAAEAEAKRLAAAAAEGGEDEDEDETEASAETGEDEDEDEEEGSKAAKAERTRIGAILRSDAAKGREVSALALALDTAVTAKQAVGILKGMPVAKTGGLTQQMRALGRTAVKPGGGPDASGPDAIAQRIASA